MTTADRSFFFHQSKSSSFSSGEVCCNFESEIEVKKKKKRQLFYLAHSKEKHHSLRSVLYCFLEMSSFFFFMYNPLGFIKRVTDTVTENVERIKTSPFDMSRANTLEVDEYLTQSEFLYFFFFLQTEV